MNQTISVVLPEYFVRALDRFCELHPPATRSEIIQFFALTPLVWPTKLEELVEEEKKKEVQNG